MYTHSACVDAAFTSDEDDRRANRHKAGPGMLHLLSLVCVYIPVTRIPAACISVAPALNTTRVGAIQAAMACFQGSSGRHHANCETPPKCLLREHAVTMRALVSLVPVARAP